MPATPRFSACRWYRRAGSYLLGSVLVFTTSCGEGGGVTPPDTTVDRVDVSASAVSLRAGESLQLSAMAKNAAGGALASGAFSWQSSDAAVASVSAAGLVNGVSPGTATITAVETGSGKSGTLALTITAAPVAKVVVTSPQPRLKTGKRIQLTGTPTDAAGAPLTGREIAWSTSAPGVATVGADGALAAVGAGTVTVTATSEGRSGSVSLEVFQLPPASVVLPPRLKVMAVGDTVHLRPVALDAEGDTIPRQPLWTTSEVRRGSAAVLELREAGVFHATALGHVALYAELDQVRSGTVVVAVTEADELFATALAGGAERVQARRGEKVTVPLVLDMSRVQAPGDLGALEIDVTYPHSVLRLDSATPGLAGSVGQSSVPGRYRLSFASSTPAGTARLTVVTLVFEVAAGALPGDTARLEVKFPSAPASTGFAAYKLPIVAAGTVHVLP